MRETIAEVLGAVGVHTRIDLRDADRARRKAAHGARKYTDAKEQEILAPLRAGRMTMTEVARRYHVSRATVRNMWRRQYPNEVVPKVVDRGYSDDEERTILALLRDGTATIEAVARGRRLSRAVVMGMWHRQYPGEPLPLRKCGERVGDEGKDLPACCGRVLKHRGDYATDRLGRLVAHCPRCGRVPLE